MNLPARTTNTEPVHHPVLKWSCEKKSHVRFARMFLVPDIAKALIQKMDGRFIRSLRSVLLDLKMEHIE